MINLKTHDDVGMVLTLKHHHHIGGGIRYSRSDAIETFDETMLSSYKSALLVVSIIFINICKVFVTPLLCEDKAKLTTVFSHL